MNGNSDYGYGFQHDNSEGINENNITNNFEASVNAFLATPFLIKNTFSDASTSNIMLECFAIPVMKPTVAGEITYWYGGNNTISLSETSSGIAMYADSYPLMNNGYNKFYLNDATYYLEGEIPEELNDSLEVKNNYWNPSVSLGEFNITDCSVKYLPTENGADSNRATNTTVLVNIGFGKKDTIYIKDESDIPEMQICLHLLSMMNMPGVSKMLSFHTKNWLILMTMNIQEYPFKESMAAMKN